MVRLCIYITRTILFASCHLQIIEWKTLFMSECVICKWLNNSLNIFDVVKEKRINLLFNLGCMVILSEYFVPSIYYIAKHTQVMKKVYFVWLLYLKYKVYWLTYSWKCSLQLSNVLIKVSSSTVSIIKSDAKLLRSMLCTGMYKKFTCLDTKVNFEWPLNILCLVEKISWARLLFTIYFSKSIQSLSV